MKSKLKKEWIKALRSGNYDQCESTLKQESSVHKAYCCLGVLCEIDPDIENDNGSFIARHSEILAEAQRYWNKNQIDNSDHWYKEYEVKVDDDYVHFLFENGDKPNTVTGVYVGSDSLNPLVRKHHGLHKKVQHKKRRIPVQSKLIEFNDTEHKNFNQIADYLERTNL